MFLGISAAAVSSFFHAFMVMLDRLMVSDCYQGKHEQAWLASSFLGGVFGLLATGLIWLGIATTSPNGAADLVTAFLSAGLVTVAALVAAGAITIQVMKYYFRLFSSSAATHRNETGISFWLACSPVFIFVTIAVLRAALPANLFPPGLEAASSEWWLGLLIIATVLSIIRFERLDIRSGLAAARYADVFKMLGCIAAYTVLMSAVLREDDLTLAELAAFQPFYWVGFLAGCRILLWQEVRRDLTRNLRRLRKFLGLILVVEIVGMLVYLLEFFALGRIDPTLTNLIIGCHVLLVFGIAVALSRLRIRLIGGGHRRVWFAGLRLTTNRLPDMVVDSSSLSWLTISAILLFACMIAA